MAIKLTHVPKRGKNKDIPQELHRFDRGYVVSKSKHERDYKYVQTQEEVLRGLQDGDGSRFGDDRPSFVKTVES